MQLVMDCMQFYRFTGQVERGFNLVGEVDKKVKGIEDEKEPRKSTRNKDVTSLDFDI